MVSPSPKSDAGTAEYTDDPAGLCRELTAYVLDGALAQCRAWRDAGIDIWVAVNLTAADVLDGRLPDEIAAALAAHDLPGGALVVEVTENSVLTDPVRVAEILRTIQLAHNLGMRVVAEGVEDDATWADLTERSCDLIQGHGLSRPLPASELKLLLHDEVRVG